MEKVLEIGRQGYRWVLDADVSGFFDNLSHDAIMRELSDVVADGNILRLVENFKTKVRRITRRCNNLDAEMMVRLNCVIRGTGYPRHGELFRHALVALRRRVPQFGPLDTHATAVHESQTEIVGG